MGLRKALRLIAESGWTLVGGGTMVGALGNKLFPPEVLLSASLSSGGLVRHSGELERQHSGGALVPHSGELESPITGTW